MQSEGPQIEHLAAKELARRLHAGDPLLLLDVREDIERRICVISAPDEVCLHVPIGEVTLRFEEIRSASAGRPIVVYCHHGVRSWAVASWLGHQGLSPIANLEGGIDQWSKDVDPTVARY